jgi:hypothetical protein
MLVCAGAADSHSGARDRGRATLWCAADPCESANDGECDVPQYCATGDYIDCGTAGPVVNGTLPDAIGSLACKSKITEVYARWRRALFLAAAFIAHY